MSHVDGGPKAPPKYWAKLTHLDSSAGPENAMQEFAQPENADAIALEVSEPPSRREFLKLLGAGAAFAAAGCARKPVEKILPYVHAPEELVPGVPVYYASTCGECPAGCGVLVKTREGRPIRSRNKAHPLNRGALCPHCQASLLGLTIPTGSGAALHMRGKGSSKLASWRAVDERVIPGARRGARTRQVVL
jgi:molybdopterin-containing oxidoreductase family iron-sulfur binding subunit